MEKQSLYNIENKYMSLVSEIEASGGEFTEEMEKELIINKEEREEKSIAYLSVITSKEETISTIDTEIKRLQALKKTESNIIDRLKNNLLTSVVLHGSYEVGLTKFGVRKSKRLEIKDGVTLDRQYLTTKTTISPNKALITKVIKAGADIDGCILVESENLKIN